MEAERVIILPLDGFASGRELLNYLLKIIEEEDLQSLLAYIKLNDGVHNSDMGGPQILADIKKLLRERNLPIKIFLDLKIGDVSGTVINTLKKYVDYPPDILTVSALCSVESIMKLRKLLPTTKLALLSALTDISREEFLIRFGMTPEVKIFNDLNNIYPIYHERVLGDDSYPDMPFDLVVCSPKELVFLKRNLSDSYEFIVPGIRDEWMKKDHQQRTTGVNKAISMGATFVVMGAQIVKGNPGMGVSAKESRRLTMLELRKTSNPLVILANCDGYYCSPFEGDVPLGPLVAYAGTYATAEGPKNFVGYEYFNFAKAEQNPKARDYFASNIQKKLVDKKITADVFLGAPMGGILLAGDLGRKNDARSIFAEKQIISLADPTSGKKEESLQIIKRHDIDEGDRVIIVEDVCNNFSTTMKLQEAIEEKGGKLVAIACAINRSGLSEWNGIPVIASATAQAAQFRQDDPFVSDLIATGKIVWKPKNDWLRLKEAMGI